jgi:large subunit ribosomal protein L23
MALFGSKKSDKKDVKAKAQVEKKAQADLNASSDYNLLHILKRPRITEKSSIISEKGVYVFEVAKTATKGSIAKAIKELYNVTPARIAVLRIPEKTIVSQGKYGTKPSGKKAYVYLKKGETIEIA